MAPGLIILGVVVFVGMFIVGNYNGLIGLKNQVQEAFSGMDVQLKKRYDLIPNLVASVEKYMDHEKETLTKLTALRAKAMDPNVSTEEKLEVEAQIGTAMKGIMVAVENYPDLKASENMLQLQRSLNEVEEQLSAARRFYNAAVKQLNNKVMMFPSNVIAGMFNITTEKMFETAQEERQNVNVGELFSK